MSQQVPNPYQPPVAIDGAVVVGESLPPLEVLRSKLATTALGLTLIYWGIVSMLLTVIGMVAVQVFIGVTGFGSVYSAVVLFVMVAINMCAFGCVFLGPFLCLFAPRGYGLRTLAGLVVASQLTLVCVILISTRAFGGQFTQVFAFGICATLNCIVFLAFLCRLARVIDRDDLMRRGRNLFILATIVGAGLVAAGAFVQSQPSNTAYALFAPLVPAIGCLVVFVSFANLVNELARAIRRPSERRPLVGIL